MECNLSTLRNAIKGVACAQTSIPFRNAIKRSCLQNLCTLTEVYRIQCCSGASGLIVDDEMVMGARKKELGAWHEKTKSINAATTL